MAAWVDGASPKTRIASITEGLVSGLRNRVHAGVIDDEEALAKKLKAILNDVVELGEKEALASDPKALISYIETTLTTLLDSVKGETVKEMDVVKTVIRTLIHEAYDLGKGTK